MNNWQILGIQPTSDKREIKRAYGKMLVKYHPEEHPEQFARIKDAYDTAMMYADMGVGAYIYDDVYNNEEHNTYTNGYELIEDELNWPDEEQFTIQVTNYSPNDSSIFITDELSEESDKDNKLVQMALDEIKSASRSTRNKDSKLKGFFSTELFSNVKRNPQFVDRFTELFPTCYINNERIKIYRDAFGLTLNDQIYYGDLIRAINILDLRIKKQSRDKMRSKLIERIIVAVLTVFVLFLIIRFSDGQKSDATDHGIVIENESGFFFLNNSDIILTTLPWKKAELETYLSKDDERIALLYDELVQSVARYLYDVYGKTTKTYYQLDYNNLEMTEWVVFYAIDEPNWQTNVLWDIKYEDSNLLEKPSDAYSRVNIRLPWTRDELAAFAYNDESFRAELGEQVMQEITQYVQRQARHSITAEETIEFEDDDFRVTKLVLFRCINERHKKTIILLDVRPKED